MNQNFLLHFSGDPAFKTSPSTVRGKGSIPGWGTKITQKHNPLAITLGQKHNT